MHLPSCRRQRSLRPSQSACWLTRSCTDYAPKSTDSLRSRCCMRILDLGCTDVIVVYPPWLPCAFRFRRHLVEAALNSSRWPASSFLISSMSFAASLSPAAAAHTALGDFLRTAFLQVQPPMRRHAQHIELGRHPIQILTAPAEIAIRGVPRQRQSDRELRCPIPRQGALHN